MKGNNMKIKAVKQPWQPGMEFLLYEDGENGSRYVVKPISLDLTAVKEVEMIETTFRIRETKAIEFIKSMAELAEEMGIKTDKQISEERKYQGKLEAVEDHLLDMRKIVSKKLQLNLIDAGGGYKSL